MVRIVRQGKEIARYGDHREKLKMRKHSGGVCTGGRFRRDDRMSPSLAVGALQWLRG
jgi:hypothetical protein